MAPPVGPHEANGAQFAATMAQESRPGVARGHPRRCQAMPAIDTGQAEEIAIWFKKYGNLAWHLGESAIFGRIMICLPFAVCRQAWEYGSMNPRRLFDWLIVLTVAAGLVSLPVAGPAAARAHHAAAGGQMHAMDGDMHAMGDGMPCCPDDGKAAKDCDACPLMALCSLTISVPAPSGVFALAPGDTAESAFAFPDDLLLDGLSARPPDHPPRTIV